MFVLFNKNHFFIILISIVFVSASDDQQSTSDDMCKLTRSVLCVKDVLMIIATVVKSINRTANEIEKHILNKIQIVDTLNRYVNFEMGIIHSHLPTPQYHVQFFQSNNIDKTYLGDLLLEAHYSMSFYYNSIEDLLNMNDVFAFTSDSWLKQIEFNLRNEIICRYRSVLNVYSHQWPSIHQIDRIQFSTRKYPNISSLVHDVHAIIITRLLREWMQRLHSVIINLEFIYMLLSNSISHTRFTLL